MGDPIFAADVFERAIQQKKAWTAGLFPPLSSMLIDPSSFRSRSNFAQSAESSIASNQVQDQLWALMLHCFILISTLDSFCYSGAREDQALPLSPRKKKLQP